MDDFLRKTICDRCGQPFNGARIMSMYNEDCICMRCKEQEQLRPDYQKALDAENNEAQKGNLNYKGIGITDTLNNP